MNYIPTGLYGTPQNPSGPSPSLGFSGVGSGTTGRNSWPMAQQQDAWGADPWGAPSGYGYGAARSAVPTGGLGNSNLGSNNLSMGNGLSSFSGQGGTSAGGSGSSSGNNFTTLNNVKSGQFQTGINNLSSNINGLNFNPNVNPNVLYSNTKNPALQTATNNFISQASGGQYTNPRDFTKSSNLQGNLNAGYGNYANSTAQNQQQFGNYLSNFNAQTPGVTSNVNQENDAISNIYNGGLQGQLNQNAQQEASAVNQSAQRALLKNQQLNSATQIGGGNNSYAQKQSLDTGANIQAQEALRQADLGRSNIQYMQGQQLGANGLRNSNLAGLANRQLQPIQNLQSMDSGALNQLGNLGNIDNSNNIYTTQAQQGQNALGLINGASVANNNNTNYTQSSPQSFYAQQASLLGSGVNSNNQNNFYGISTPYNGYNQTPSYSGGWNTQSAPQQSRGYGGGGMGSQGYNPNYGFNYPQQGGYGQPQYGGYAPQMSSTGVPTGAAGGPTGSMGTPTGATPSYPTSPQPTYSYPGASLTNMMGLFNTAGVAGAYGLTM